jgi:hypothetical protein
MSADLNGLAPAFRRKVDQVLRDMVAQGLDPLVIEARRSDVRQAYLYGFGRTYDDGRGIVTNARTASNTMHGYGLAVDIISKSKQWNAPASFWQALAVTAEKYGCAAGLRWKMKDSPHIQMGGIPVSPTEQMIASRAAGGAERVWNAIGANA